MLSILPKGFFVLSISFILFGFVPAFADSCPAAKEFEAQIISCGNNSVAVDHAKECMKSVQAEGEALVNELHQAASSRDRQKLNTAIQQSVGRITLMQDQTDKVAKYADVMIDDPNSNSLKTSLECFVTNFKKLQKLINVMDDEIIRAMQARDVAVGVFKKLGK